MDCSECHRHRAASDLCSVYGTFVVHGKAETPPVPGWMVIAPLAHVTQYDELDAGQMAELGTLIGKVAAALRATTVCEKIYVCVFAEVLQHLHVHVIARPPDYPVKGPAIFSASAGDASAFDAVTRAVIQRLQ